MDRPGPDQAHLPVRRATSGDVAQIRDLAVDNAIFAPEDLGGLDETLTGYLGGSLAGHEWIVAEASAGVIAGAAYYAPEPFADRVWNLYFLAVHPARHRTGIGHALVAHVERSLCGAGDTVARVLIVETSSTDPYQQARRFYAREGFDQEAVIREFYGPDDNKIVFWKRLVR
jgi:ribosomal protein S18 acetylase RimI-like enzyme